MNTQSIICSKCGNDIELTTAMRSQLEDQIQKEYNQKFATEKARITQSLKQEAEGKYRLEIQDLQGQIQQKSGMIKQLEADQQALRQRQRDLDEKEQRLESELQNRLEQEKPILVARAKKQAEQQLSLQIQDLQNQVQLKSGLLIEAQGKELELRQQKHELEQREQALELNFQRKLDEGRQLIRQQATDQAAQNYSLKISEQERTIAGMLRQIEDLKRKAEQGSQQSQGETFELELEKVLRHQFSNDEILPVPKGVRGADILQHVKSPLGNYCGTIIWESKRTKAWSDEWIKKLKADQREVKANVAVIVSTALPKGVRHINIIDGVWVVDFVFAIGLAMALRKGLYDVAQAKHAMAGRTEKMALVYQYLVGHEFRQFVEAVVGSLVVMQEELAEEKRAMARIWAKREKQINLGLISFAKFYGDLQGVSGGALQSINKLELPAGKDDLPLIGSQSDPADEDSIGMTV